MLRTGCEESKAGARRVCHGTTSTNQVGDDSGLNEVAATEMEGSGQILDMAELAFSELQIHLKIQLDWL